jgi:tetratricopeptide (TPR) repeat protein
LKLYREAFSKAASPQLLFTAFDGLFRLERDFGLLVQSSRDLLAQAKDAPFPPGLAFRLARFFELSGRLEDALTLYRREIAANASPEALQAALRLCIEMNDMDAASQIIASKPELQGGVLAGQIALQRGDIMGARTCFKTILGSSPDPKASLQAMYGLYSVAVAGGDQAEIGQAADLLVRSFPRSPEAAVARTAGKGSATEKVRVLLAPIPMQALDAALWAYSAAPAAQATPAAQSTEAVTQSSPPQSHAQPAADQASAPLQDEAREAHQPDAQAETPPASKPEGKVSVQAGSYRVRENAEDMVLELKKQGFPAMVREYIAGGATYYKAIASAAVEMDEAKKIMERLREIGFEGILLFDGQ